MPEPDETLDEEVEQETEAETDLRGAAGASAAKKARKERDEALREARDLKARLKKIEDADKSETERLRADLAELKERDRERESTVERDRADRERTDYVRRAAKELKFVDEDDTVALLRGHGLLDDIESEEDATTALKRIAKTKPHLVQRPEGEVQSRLDEILHDGKPSGPRKDEADPNGPKTGDEMYAMDDSDFLRWKLDHPEAYRQSLEGWTGNETHAAPPTPQVAIRR